MDFANIVIVLIFLIGSAVLGFLAAWLIRQGRIDNLQELVADLELELHNKKELANQYQDDRNILKDEVEKYKNSYNTQMTKVQRLSENNRQNQEDISLLEDKVKNLTETLLQSTQDLEKTNWRLSVTKEELDSVKLDLQKRIEQADQIQSKSTVKSDAKPIVRRIIRSRIVPNSKATQIAQSGMSLLDKSKIKR